MQNIKTQLAAECKTANEMIGYKARLGTYRFVNFCIVNQLLTIISLSKFSDWKLSTPTPEEMAAAGFYMTGKEDETRSPFNMKIIAGWEEGDSPQKEVRLMIFFTKF